MKCCWGRRRVARVLHFGGHALTCSSRHSLRDSAGRLEAATNVMHTSAPSVMVKSPLKFQRSLHDRKSTRGAEHLTDKCINLRSQFRMCICVLFAQETALHVPNDGRR